MRILFLVSAIALFGTVFSLVNASADSKMLPLSDYLKVNSTDNPATREYALTRCVALYMSVAGIVRESDENLATSIDAKVKPIFRSVSALRQESGQDNSEERVYRAISSMTEFYIKAAQEAWVKSGSYFENTLFRQDLQVCNLLTAEEA